MLLSQNLWAQFSFDSSKIWRQLNEVRAQSEKVSQINFSAIDLVSAQDEEQRKICEEPIAQNLLDTIDNNCLSPLIESGSALDRLLSTKKEVLANIGKEFRTLTEGLSQGRFSSEKLCNINTQLFGFRTQLLRHNEELKAQENQVYSYVEALFGSSCEQPYQNTLNQIQEGAWRACTKDFIDEQVSFYIEQMKERISSQVNPQAGEPYVASRKLRQELVFLANSIDQQIVQIDKHLEAIKASCGEAFEVAGH